MKAQLASFLLASLALQGSAQQAPPRTPHANEFEMPAPAQTNDYPLTEDSKPQPGVPKGTTFDFTMTDSKVFPGTTRKISVYVPAQYTGSAPACVYVGLDGIGFNAPIVFDNLIAQHAMPITIAIGVAPGSVASSNGQEDPRYDRSMEFDGRNGRLAAFLLEEVFPNVERKGAPDGRAIHLSTNPDDRSIGGGSTGGIGAFTVAWERPDAFHRVFSSIGTFVGMRGGEQYNVLVRKTEPKPIRIFMEDGIHDEWGGGPEIGDWWMSNLTMQRALDFAGYDVRHVWGLGNHSGAQAAQLFPEAMRWMWRDYPAPITAQTPGNPVLKAILNPGETWQSVGEGCNFSLRLTADPQGVVRLPAQPASLDSRPRLPCGSFTDAPYTFGPDGKIVDTKWAAMHGVDGATAIIATSKGDLYLTANVPTGGQVWLIHPDGKLLKVAEGIKGASSLALSPDNLWLYVAQHDSHLSLSYQVLPDGTLANGEPLYDLAVPAWADDSGASAVAMDRDGRAYVATRLGIQVMDHNGRAVAILPLPGNQPATSLTFGGDGFTTLYAASGGHVYKRIMKVPGLAPANQPIKIPNWGSG